LRQRQHAVCPDEAGDAAVGVGDRLQAVGQRRHHDAVDIVLVAEAVDGARRDEQDARREEEVDLLAVGQFAAALGDEKYLEEGVVAMRRDLEIVQVRARRNRLAMEPEVGGFARLLTIKPICRHGFLCIHVPIVQSFAANVHCARGVCIR